MGSQGDRSSFAMPETPPTDGLRAKVLRGFAWKTASRIVLQVSRFAVAVILARLLAPHDYGLAAMVLVFSGFVVLVGETALGTALIQRREISEADRSTVFWTGLATGLLLTVFGIVLAGPLAAFYGEPAVSSLFAVLSLSFVVTALGTTQTALLTREMNFRALEIRQMAAAVVGAVVGIGAAVHGYGAWSIVAQQLAIASVSTILLWQFSSWRPSFRFSWASLKSFAAFTGSVYGQNLLYYGGRNADNVLVGRYLGASALGVYALAYNIMLAPFHSVAGLIQQVMFPAFSRLQDDRKKMADVWIRMTRMVAAFTMPALAGLAIVAADFVDVLLGSRWSDATRVIQILAIVGLIQSLQTVNGDILVALGRAGTFFRFTILWFAASLCAFVIGLQWGIIGVAACYAVSCMFVEPLNAYITARALGTPLTRLIRALGGVSAATACMGIVVLAARIALVHEDVAPAARLALCIAIGVAVFVPLCRVLVPDVTEELGDIVGRVRRSRQRDGVKPATVAEN
jgi:PST family polysaccharide transporter